MTPGIILQALRRAYEKAGTQSALASQARVSQGRIADYLSGRCDISHMEISTFLRLFPKMKIEFFGNTEEDDDLMRDQLLKIWKLLSRKDRMRCLTLIAANFPKQATTI